MNQDPHVVRGRLVYQYPDAHWPPANASWPPPPVPGALAAAAASPRDAPEVRGHVVLEACAPASAVPPNQSWSFGKTGEIISQCEACSPQPQTQLCLTYGGYKEANTGLASCENWNAPGIGGQAWRISNGSITNTAEPGIKCLAAFDCNGSLPLQTCTCDGSDCAPGKQAVTPPCPSAMLFERRGKSQIKSNLVTAHSDAKGLCVTASKATALPQREINITLQIWAKPLADGSVAALAFNRGESPIAASFDFAQLGLPNPPASHLVRDLWAKEDKGKFNGAYSDTVQPHDVVMVTIKEASNARKVELAQKTDDGPDLVVDFSSDLLRGPKARPATHAVTGLLNGGPEFGARFLDPLRMGNYRGSECQSPSAYAAMVKVSHHDIAGIWVAFFSRYLVVDRLARRTSSATWISWQRTARHCLRTSTTRACVPSGPDGAAIGARGRRGSAS